VVIAAGDAAAKLCAGEPNPLGAGEPNPLGAGEPNPLDAGEPNPLDAGEPNPLDAGEPNPLDAGEPNPPEGAPPNPLLALLTGMPAILVFTVCVVEVDVGLAAVPANFSCVRPKALIPSTAPMAM